MCSAAETTFDSGAFATTIPRLRRGVDVDVVDPDAGAADNLQLRARSISSAVTFVADRTIRPS